MLQLQYNTYNTKYTTSGCETYFYSDMAKFNFYYHQLLFSNFFSRLDKLSSDGIIGSCRFILYLLMVILIRSPSSEMVMSSSRSSMSSPLTVIYTRRQICCLHITEFKGSRAFNVKKRFCNVYQLHTFLVYIPESFDCYSSVVD